MTFAVWLLSGRAFSRELYRLVLPDSWYSPWRRDPEFQQSYKDASGLTLLTEEKLYTLFLLARRQATIPGDFVELGVFRGGSLTVLAKIANEQNRKIWGFDSWSKSISAKEFSYPEAPDLKRLQAEIKNRNLKSVQLVDGLIPESLHQFASDRISLLHLDLYSSDAAISALNYFKNRLNSGSVVVAGAFGAISLPELTASLENYFHATEWVFVRAICGSAVWIKR